MNISTRLVIPSLGFLVVQFLLISVIALPCSGESPRPKLQVINGSDQIIDVFWLRTPVDRIASGTISPRENMIIKTSVGHQFVIVGREDGVERTVESQVPIQSFRFDPQSEDGVPSFYTQRMKAGGLLIVASAEVNPYAVREAKYLVDAMLGERPEVRQAMIDSGARLCVLAHNEFTTDLPEFVAMRDQPHPDFPQLSGHEYWDARARGTGGSETDPYCTCAEENLLGYEGDPYWQECILIHELAHSIHLRGMNNLDATFDQRLRDTYSKAMEDGLWKGKYAAVNHYEYFAEGVQSWFNNNRTNDRDHNHVNTRMLLREYDPALAALCGEVFGDTSLEYSKPVTRLKDHLNEYDPSTAPKFVWPKRLDHARKVIASE
ncbi:hypothetical protein Pla22_04000 [Rubripirellula amarantea]|uniref:Uncharacterized protein n=1 Tax=Rubripirellula amarantea TaxID=2527999 RepID=A0A5C5WPJ0_9BACT|nr:hypothetical protein [Rubripirellula amarantea]TWT52774.1 hypothetical protein Pla22_04000 [Rubripirellula amarantea]